MKDIFDDFSWHSGFELDGENISKKKTVKKLGANKNNLKKFVRANKDSNFLVHRATKALWRFSDDGSFIEPVFEEDILTEDEL